MDEHDIDLIDRVRRDAESYVSDARQAFHARLQVTRAHRTKNRTAEDFGLPEGNSPPGLPLLTCERNLTHSRYDWDI